MSYVTNRVVNRPTPTPRCRRLPMLCKRTIAKHYLIMAKNIEDVFFGNDDEDENVCLNDTHGELSQRENASIERHYWTLGYHETYEESQDSSLQGGFESGYRDAYEVAVRIGQLLGQHAATATVNASHVPLVGEGQRQDHLGDAQSSSKPSPSSETAGKIQLDVAVNRIREVLSTITEKGTDAETALHTTNRTVVPVSSGTNLPQPRQQSSISLQKLEQELESIFGVACTSTE
jgi:hypothetical protein